MTTDNRLEDIPDRGTGLTAADRRHAALAICQSANDADDARVLLEALGLLDELRGAEQLAAG